MSLMASLHLLASVICVAAAVVMLRSDDGRRNRGAHLLVLTAMVVLTVVGHSVAVAFACALALAGTAAVVHRRGRRAGNPGLRARRGRVQRAGPADGGVAPADGQRARSRPGDRSTTGCTTRCTR